ncbi:MAG TPA: hypothetical protein VHM47_00080 [Actinomycetota bacterium]|jgi:hypothetical protein|nr:hypothetical protein [Actinomycetota bacterium]
MSDLGRPGPASEDTIWELRNPDGGSQGLEFAKARMGEHHVVLVHAAPSRLNVAVRSVNEVLLAIGTDLHAPGETPMSRLTLDDLRVVRENVWPSEEDLDLPVILPGGEVGILRSWWNAGDHSAWRWTIELSNSV